MKKNHLEKNDIYKVEKLHPLWIFIKIIKSFRELVFLYIFLAFVLNLNSITLFSEYKWILFLSLIIFNILSIILKWKHFSYYLSDNELFIEKGRFFTTKRYIPLDKIQGIHQKTPFFIKFFGFTSLFLDMGTNGTESSIKLDMISHTEASNIKKHLAKTRNLTEKQKDSKIEIEYLKSTSLNGHSSSIIHYKIRFKEILIASLTSLRLIFFFTLIYSIYSEVNQFFSVQKYIDYILGIFLVSLEMKILGVVILLICSLSYGLLKTYIQYGGFSVASDQNYIHIKKGITNYTEFSIPKEKVQALNIKKSLLQKWIGIVRVRLIIANSGDEQLQSSNILFPFIKINFAKSLINVILPSFYIREKMTSVPKKSIFVKIMRTSYIWLISALFIIFDNKFWYVAVIISSLTTTSQILKGLFSAYYISNSFIQYQKSGLSTTIFLTNQTKIEELKVTETFIQRKIGLASLVIVSRANPAKKTRILDIPSEVAHEYYANYANLKYGQQAKTAKYS